MDRRRFLRTASTGLIGISSIGALLGCRHSLEQDSNRASAINEPIPDVNVDAILDSILEQFRAPGLGAAVVRGADLIGLGVSGLRAKNGTAEIEAGDLFHIGSCTKSMTATLVAILVEEGVLGWDTTIADVFHKDLEHIHPDYHHITPSLFLSHRSGVAGVESPGPYNAIQSTYWNYIGEITNQRYKMLKDVLHQAPAKTPDTTYSYSNLGYIFAASMLEQITGYTWEELIVEKLFDPMGITSAGFGAPGMPDEEDQPWGHDGPACNAISPGLFADNPAILGPAGRVHLTLEDWAKYASLHLLGGQGAGNLLLKPESFELLHNDPSDQEYAMGWVLESRPWTNGTAIWHNGSNTLWYAELWIAPQANHAFMAAANCASEASTVAVKQAISKLVGAYL